MDHSKLEATLRAIVEKRIAEGREVRADGSGGFIEGNRCCLLGCVAVEAGIKARIIDAMPRPHGKVAAFLGIEEEEARALEAGFENWRYHREGYAMPCLVSAFDLGERIRRDYAADSEDAS